jgi:hypothetical protein
MKSIEKIGEFSEEVINVLNLEIPVGTAIYIGESNLRHMKNTHPREFEKYYRRLPRILSDPDYVGINQSDGSIEIVKIFSKYIKIAVRIANDGDYYIRSLYEVGKSRVESSLKNGQLKSLTKQ